MGGHVVAHYLQVEVVQQAGHSPQFLILGEATGQGAHDRLGGQAVLDQVVRLELFRKQCVRFRPLHIRHPFTRKPSSNNQTHGQESL